MLREGGEADADADADAEFGEGDLGVEARLETLLLILLGALERVVMAERASERRLLVSASRCLAGESRGADVGPGGGAGWDLERPLGRARRESVDGRG